MTSDPNAMSAVELAAVLEELVSSQRQLRAVIDNMPAMIGYWDRNLINVLGNEAYVEWFGMTPEQMRGRHIREVIGEKLFALNWPYMEGALAGRPQHFDRTIIDASGDVRYAQAAYIPDVDDSGDVRGFFVLVTDVTPRILAELELEQARAELELRANTDPLTGLANRSMLESRIELALAGLRRAEPGTRRVAVLLIDLDGFKPVNDTYGHAVGDEILIEVAHRLQAEVREPELVARLGGDEFVVLVSGPAEPSSTIVLAQRLINAVHRPYLVPNHPEQLAISASVGVTWVVAGDDDISPRSLLRDADRLMYEAKRSGGDRQVSRYSERGRSLSLEG